MTDARDEIRRASEAVDIRLEPGDMHPPCRGNAVPCSMPGQYAGPWDRAG